MERYVERGYAPEFPVELRRVRQREQSSGVEMPYLVEQFQKRFVFPGEIPLAVPVEEDVLRLVREQQEFRMESVPRDVRVFPSDVADHLYFFLDAFFPFGSVRLFHFFNVEILVFADLPHVRHQAYQVGFRIPPNVLVLVVEIAQHYHSDLFRLFRHDRQETGLTSREIPVDDSIPGLSQEERFRHRVILPPFEEREQRYHGEKRNRMFRRLLYQRVHRIYSPIERRDECPHDFFLRKYASRLLQEGREHDYHEPDHVHSYRRRFCERTHHEESGERKVVENEPERLAEHHVEGQNRHVYERS